MGRVLVTQDKGFERLVALALKSGMELTGVIIIDKDSSLVSAAEDMELVAKAEDPAIFKEGVYYIPL